MRQQVAPRLTMPMRQLDAHAETRCRRGRSGTNQPQLMDVWFWCFPPDGGIVRNTVMYNPLRASQLRRG